MIKKAGFGLIAAVLLALSSAAGALTFNDAAIDKWVGSGDKSAALVIDFGTKSFAFGYKWTGTASGWDILDAVRNSTTLTVGDDTSWGGHIVNSLSYKGFSGSYDSENWDPTSHWWEFWTSTDGAHWSSYMAGGCADFVLTDGDWTGWTFAPPYGEYDPAPVTPTVPEPSCAAVLFSMIGLVGCKRLLRRSGK